MNVHPRNFFSRWLLKQPAPPPAPESSPLERRHSELLAIMTQALSAYIDEENHRQAFDLLLQRILEFTDSAFGFIGEVLHDESGQPYLKTFAISNIAWNEETLQFYARQAPAGMEFRNLDSLFGEVLRSGQPLLSNAPQQDPRRAGLPPGHPALDCFLGLPLHHHGELVGMLGIANRPTGYDLALRELLTPLLATLGQLIAALQRDAQRQQTQLEVQRQQEALREERQRLASIIESTDLGTWEWNVQSGATVFNSRWASMLGYRLDELAPLDVNTWVRLTHPEDLEHCRSLLNQHFSGALPYYNSTLRMRHQAGHWVWVNARGSLVKRTPEGLPLLMYGTHSDISASHQQDEEVRRTRAFLQAVVDSSTEVAMIATDPNGLITLFNSGAERLLGYSSAAMVGLQTPAVFHLPSEIEARAAALRQALGRPISGIQVFTEKTCAQEPATRTWTYVRQDGQQRQVNLSVTAIRDEHEQISGFLGIATDISTQLQISRALQDNQQRLHSMISNLPGVVYRCRNDGSWSIVHISDEIERLTGYPASDFSTQQRSLNSLILPSDLPATRSAQNSLADGDVFEVNYRIRHAAGHIVWVSEKGRGAYADSGELLWLDGFLWDISANVAAEQERREREDYVHTVLDNVIDGILTFSPQGIIESCNRAAEQIFALDPAHTLGLNASSLLAEPYRADYRQHIRALLQKDAELASHGLPRELEGRRQTGEHFPLEVALSRISHRGELKIIAVVRDITERKRVERMQSEFVSTVSHELRTPLTSIAGALGLINGGALGAVPEAMAQMLGIAQHNSQRLSLLINDLLDMDKLNAGQMRFDLQAHPLQTLLEQALQANQTYADEYLVHWRLLAVPENATLRVDAQRFSQVMANLLSNAAKHAPANSAVEIHSSVLGQQLRIEVRDYGSGIPEAFRPRIFSKFAQADSSDRRQLGGTGLGLAISRELVERMHGQIGFSCEPGQGTRFWFSLPSASTA